MKTYKVSFRCVSRLNKIPDAQTIFGAICNSLKLYSGEKALKDYLKSFDETPLMIHSSMFPIGVYPAMKTPLITNELISKYILNLDGKKQVEKFSELKKYKNLKYISEKVFSTYISNGKIELLKTDLINSTNNFILEDDILKMRNETITLNYKDVLSTRIRHFSNTDENDSELYYDHDIFFENGQVFVIYVKSNEDKDFLENIFDKFDHLPLGNRSSSGKNMFKFIKIERIDFSTNTIKKLLLSKCTPNEDDFIFEESEYGVESQNYVSAKSYGNKYLGVMTKLIEGSYMKVREDKDYYGRLIPMIVDDRIIYHYGIGFVL